MGTYSMSLGLNKNWLTLVPLGRTIKNWQDSVKIDDTDW